MEVHDHEGLTVEQMVVAGSGSDEHLSCAVCGQRIEHGICFGCGSPLNSTNMTESRRGLVVGCRKCKVWDGNLMELPPALRQYRDRLQQNIRGANKLARAKLEEHDAKAELALAPRRPASNRSRRSLVVSVSAIAVAAALVVLAGVQLSRSHSVTAAAAQRK